MPNKSVVLFLIASQLFAAPVRAQSAAESTEIKSKFAVFKGKSFSCTGSRKAIRRLAKEHPAYYFAFAGRKAPTITGIRGCGYAWNIDLDKARSVAMENCKKWEVQYGTSNGKWTCRYMR